MFDLTQRSLGRAADLWLLDESAVDGLSAALSVETLLSPEELARYTRLRRAGVRRRFLGGRLLCRHALSAYADVAPAAWTFAAGRFGRPELEPNPHGLTFNLSHTEGLIACVITRGAACGVDVENVPARPEAVALADGHFARRERVALANAGDDRARADRFVDFWVLKESYTKALGVGLSRRMSTFGFDLGPPAVTVTDEERDPGERRDWQFELLRIGPRHACGVAVRRVGCDGQLLQLRTIDFVSAIGRRDPRRAPLAVTLRHADVMA
ncbi:4'-phosphopantetheinyl transferase superfamily protein [Solirubrobacter taibaiensis]|nr:4'-phosphopantetheinyl transferase superfamily protein [Solirubrobacter taibaiensis]